MHPAVPPELHHAVPVGAVQRVGPLDEGGEAELLAAAGLVVTTEAEHVGAFGSSPGQVPVGLAQLDRRRGIDRGEQFRSWTPGPACAGVRCGELVERRAGDVVAADPAERVAQPGVRQGSEVGFQVVLDDPGRRCVGQFGQPRQDGRSSVHVGGTRVAESDQLRDGVAGGVEDGASVVVDHVAQQAHHRVDLGPPDRGPVGDHHDTTRT